MELRPSKMQRTLASKALAFFGFVFYLVIFVTAASETKTKKSKVVSTLLNAKWARTSFVLEAAEFLAEDNNDYFWALMDYLAEPDNLDMEAKLTDEELYNRVITFCSR